MTISGFYIIKDEFFHDMTDPYLKGNKLESRPHYPCFLSAKDGQDTHLLMISRPSLFHLYLMMIILRSFSLQELLFLR